MAEGLVQRVNARQRNTGKTPDGDDGMQKDDDDEVLAKSNAKRSKFTLMEELLLLSLKEDTGELFIFNDSVSYALRACFLIELAAHGCLELEPLGARRRNSQCRNLLVVNSATTGDPLLDEALRTISESSETDSVGGWLDLLSGETWNPFQMKYQMREVRTRICKGLVEKGVCSTSKQNYVLFNLTVHPVADGGVKTCLFSYFNNLLVKNWRDAASLDPRDYALLVLAWVTSVAENALSNLDDKEYNVAMDRIKAIGDLDPEKELLRVSQPSVDGPTHHSKVMQVVFACLSAMNKT